MFMMFCIKAIVTNHFEMLVRDMNNQALNKVDGRNAFGYSFVIFMPLVMKSDVDAIISINSGGGNNGTPQVSADIFDRNIRRTEIGFSSDIKAIRMVLINLIFEFMKRRSEFKGEFF